jgi:tRNA threonylcarbamoyl adenosine modification protein YeaZ
MKQKTSKSVLLAVETSGRTGSVAVGIDEKIFEEITFSAPMRHSAELFTSVETILAKIGKKTADIGQICITSGPGSFTGIRIAVTMAKMMALASKTTILAVNTMDVIAENASEYISRSGNNINRIATILDAKRKQFYVATYDRAGDQWINTRSDQLMKAQEFIEHFAQNDEPIWLLGEGLVYYRKDFTAKGISFLDEEYWPARARNLFLLGRRMADESGFTDPAALLPNYLRRPEAIENWEKKNRSQS